MNPPALPTPVLTLASELDRRGGRLYLVGGGVRDHLMGLPLKDWDLEVFGIDAEPLAKILRGRGSVNAVGRSFGVFKWTPRGLDREIDVSIPRRDSKVGPGHRGIQVAGDPHMTLAEAAIRRDLTINALMWDVCGDRLEDPYNGLEDLAKRTLRAVDRHTFLEDPLRALRVVQFAARLGFSPDETLIELCQIASLDELPPERIAGEWGKLLLRGTHLALGFDVARRTRVLDRLFPEVASAEPPFDVVGALCSVVPEKRAQMDLEGRQWALMLSIWLASCPSAALPTLDRLGLHTILNYPTRNRVLSTLLTLDAPRITDADLRHYSTRTELLVSLTARGAIQQFDPGPTLARAQQMSLLTTPPAPLLLGRHLAPLGVLPGPAMGHLLAAVFQQQLDGVISTPEEAIRAAQQLLDAQGSVLGKRAT